MSVESPCIRHCTLNDADLCVGCGRMLDEIIGWTRFTDAEKQAIKDSAIGRLAQSARR